MKICYETASKHLSIIAISFLFLFLGHCFIPQRTPINTSETMTIRGDTFAYVSMIEGNWITTPAPFKFRILVPFLASLLPLSPTDSLIFISYISLFFCYIFIFLTCEKLGLNIRSSAIGLLTVWGSRWHFYNYHNPFLTDTLGLLMLCIMIFALFNDSFFLFLTAAVFGVLTRETTLFVVPIWLVKKELRRGILLIAISFIVLLIPRYFLASATDVTLAKVLAQIGGFQQPLTYVINVFSYWGFVWFLSIIGIWFLPNDKFVLVTVIYMSLLGGAIFTSFIANDTGRMFSILTPILVITTAPLYAELIKIKECFLALIFVLLIIFHAFASFPNVIFGEGSWVFGLHHRILVVGEIFFIILVLKRLWNFLLQEMQGKAMTQIFNNEHV